MPPLHKIRLIEQNRLAVLWRDAAGQPGAQGKRVDKDCPLTKEERTVYVATHGNMVQTVKYIMTARTATLAGAWSLLKSALGTRTRYHNNIPISRAR